MLNVSGIVIEQGNFDFSLSYVGTRLKNCLRTLSDFIFCQIGHVLKLSVASDLCKVCFESNRRKYHMYLLTYCICKNHIMLQMNEQIEDDIQKAVVLYQSSKKIPSSIMEAR